MSGFHPVIFITLSILSLAFFLAFIRLVKGPALGDRVVAFDIMTTIGIVRRSPCWARSPTTCKMKLPRNS